MNISCFVLGNCQAQFLSSALASLPGWETYAIGRRFGFDPVVGSRKPRYASMQEFWPLVQEVKNSGRMCIVLEQVTPMAAVKDYGSRSSLFDKKIYFPHVQSQALWAEKWFPKHVTDNVALDRLIRQDLAAIKKAQSKSDFPVDVHGFVSARFSKEPLFHTWGHPTAPLMAEIAQGVLQALGEIIPEADSAKLKSLIAGSNGIDNITNHPLPREFLLSGGIQWGEAGAYAAWSDAAALVRLGDSQGAVEKARLSLAEDAGNPFVWALLAQGLDRLRRNDEAEVAYLKAVELHPQAPNLRTLLGRFLLRSGRVRRAIHVAKAACDAFPADTPAYLLAVEALLEAGEVDAAVSFATVAMERAHPHAQTLLRILEALSGAGRDIDAARLKAVATQRAPKDESLRAFPAPAPT